MAQNGTVKGKVADKVTNEGIPGATIQDAANPATGAAGGLGGGGAGSVGTSPGSPGQANTGGGGGATGTGNSGAGGSGVVIISVPTANYSGTTTGSPTITTSGANTIIKFANTGSGTYTA